MTLLGLILDILLIVMLGVMIFFVMRLHNRLEVLRSGKNDLEGLLHNLINSTATAERSLMDMRGTAGDLAVTLQKQITKAGSAREELEFLLSSADKVADALVSQVSTARNMAADAPASTRSGPSFVSPMQSPAVTPQPVVTPTLAVPPRDAGAPAAEPKSARESAEQDLLRAIEKLR